MPAPPMSPCTASGCCAWYATAPAYIGGTWRPQLLSCSESSFASRAQTCSPSGVGGLMGTLLGVPRPHSCASSMCLSSSLCLYVYVSASFVHASSAGSAPSKPRVVLCLPGTNCTGVCMLLRRHECNGSAKLCRSAFGEHLYVCIRQKVLRNACVCIYVHVHVRTCMCILICL